jgi:hypothetical protein
MSVIESFSASLAQSKNERPRLGDASALGTTDFDYWQRVFDQARGTPVCAPTEPSTTGLEEPTRAPAPSQEPWSAEGHGARFKQVQSDTVKTFGASRLSPESLLPHPGSHHQSGSAFGTVPDMPREPATPCAVAKQDDQAETPSAQLARAPLASPKDSAAATLHAHLHLNAQGQWQVTVRTTALEDDRKVINAVAEALTSQNPQGAAIESIVHNGRQIYQHPKSSASGTGANEFVA